MITLKFKLYDVKQSAADIIYSNQKYDLGLIKST